jgi:hypothetical protein
MITRTTESAAQRAVAFITNPADLTKVQQRVQEMTVPMTTATMIVSAATGTTAMASRGVPPNTMSTSTKATTFMTSTKAQTQLPHHVCVGEASRTSTLTRMTAVHPRAMVDQCDLGEIMVAAVHLICRYREPAFAPVATSRCLDGTYKAIIDMLLHSSKNKARAFHGGLFDCDCL